MAITITGGSQIGVVVDSSLSQADVSVTGSTPEVDVSVSGGIGPSIIVNGTATGVYGVIGVNPFVAGANITITTTGGSLTFIGRDPPVLSVQGKTGNVTLSLSDITAAASSHTHSSSQIGDFSDSVRQIGNVLSVQGKTGAVTLSAIDLTAVQSVQGKTGAVTLSAIDLTAAQQSHTHLAAQITDLTSLASSFAPVVSVQGRTGAVTISSSDINLFAGQGAQAGSPVVVAAGGTGVSTSDSFVRSIAGATGEVVLSAGANIATTRSGNTVTISATGIPSNFVSSLNSANGDVTIAAGLNVSVSRNANTITISAINSGQAAAAIWPAIIFGG